MPLRGKKPAEITPRLKMLLFGPAGVGKTTAALNMPRAYVIDGEKGTQHYGALLEQSGSVAFETTDINEVIAEVKTLLTEKHDYRTLVIDPITTIFNDALEKAEKKVGTEFGRHWGVANQQMKRLLNLVMQLDLNVIVTAHAKTEYGDNLVKLGQTFDGYKKLDYVFDLVIELDRDKRSKKRTGKVTKTRLAQFPDGDVFPWSYEEITKRYDPTTLEREAKTVALATPEQVLELKNLLEVVRLPEGTVDKWLAKAGVDEFGDMPAETLEKCITYVKDRLPNIAAA